MFDKVVDLIFERPWDTSRQQITKPVSPIVRMSKYMEARGDLVAGLSIAAEKCEEPELNGGKQRFRAKEAHANLHDV